MTSANREIRKSCWTISYGYNNLAVIPRTLHGVEVYHGCEINILNDGTLSLNQQYIDKLDYAIAGIHMQCYENYKTMLRLCEEVRVSVIVSSDAHDPSWVGEFALATELLEETGFDETLILNNDLLKLRNFLGLRYEKPIK